jgi:hypothetical protein
MKFKQWTIQSLGSTINVDVYDSKVYTNTILNIWTVIKAYRFLETFFIIYFWCSTTLTFDWRSLKKNEFLQSA